MSEATIRLMIFAGVFLAMAAFELLAPRRAQRFGRSRRWPTNLLIVLIDSAVLRVVFPMAAVGAALWASEQGYGLFPALGLSPLVAGILAFVVLDFIVWFEHLVFHKVPLLWRVHRMHHGDPDIDVTTALRFHPIEIVVSMIVKAGVVVALGAPAVAVLVFEAVLNGAAMFNHANWRLPLWLDRILRLVIVTPDMHRVHHSVQRHETDSNYGFNLAIWDRMFGTYVAQPELGHDGMDIGLAEERGDAPTGLAWCLTVPFRKSARRETATAQPGDPVQ